PELWAALGQRLLAMELRHPSTPSQRRPDPAIPSPSPPILRPALDGLKVVRPRCAAGAPPCPRRRAASRLPPEGRARSTSSWPHRNPWSEDLTVPAPSGMTYRGTILTNLEAASVPGFG